MPIPVYESKGGYLEDTSTTANFPVPTGVVSGDIIVIPIFINGDTTTISVYASGFAEAENSPQTISIDRKHSLHVVWKRASAADTGTYDFTLSANEFRTGAALRFSGCTPSGSPWDSPTNAATDIVDGTTTPAVQVTTAGADRLLVWAASSWHINTWTPPTGFAERVESGFGTVTIADKGQAVAGASGVVQGTPATPTKRCAWLGALIGASTAVTGTISAQLGALTVAMTGIVGRFGSISCALGGLSVELVGTGSTPPVIVPTPATGGGWFGLLNIYREASALAEAERSRPPVACPNDGEPLLRAPNGTLYCPFDGWQPE